MNQPTNAGRMNEDAYAGFLKLWLTPGSRMPSASPELDAYLKHANKREPLPADLCRIAPKPRRRAA